MKKIYWMIITGALLLVTTGCSDFLDQKPDKILPDDEIFGDATMINSVLARFYGATNWGQTLSNTASFTKVDDVCVTSGEADNMQSYSNDQWRVYDYTYIREINQFLQGLRASTVLDEKLRLQFEGEARFLRAWNYFNVCRSLGGMPIIGDKVFAYTPGMDVTTLQFPRAKESELYDYIIKECTEIADYMLTTPTVHAARATKWAALMLKARAAVYAGSLATYNNRMAGPIKTDGGEVGIPANLAKGYYETALAAANEVINSGKYKLQLTETDDLGRNYYNALCVKEKNTEVIWARDYKYPGDKHVFTNQNIPATLAEDQPRCYSGPVLNLVEAFEYVNDRNGEIQIRDAEGNYVFYDTPGDAFSNKDARLWGTVIYPGAQFRGTSIVLQAGQKYLENGAWKTRTSAPGKKGDDGRLITSQNGPVSSNEVYVNKSGFLIRKFLDEADGASTNSKGSEMWYPRFRMAEAYMIACEASFELGQTGEALDYINEVRGRAGIQDLKVLTFNDIVRENRVEFALEDHRYWDLKRWRLADAVWNGVQNDPNAQLYGLFPYQVNAPGTTYDKKWVFEKTKAHVLYPRRFQLQNYYNFLDQAWLNNNPKLVKNPYQ